MLVYSPRSHDQWIQAARSGSRNIPEGYLQEGGLTEELYQARKTYRGY